MQSTLYLTLKSLHIISVISWMAGILYLYRLFVYHAEETEEAVKRRLRIMERRLYRYITVPAMVASLVFGLPMLFLVPGFLAAGWVHTKLLFVALLVGMTLFASSQIERMETQPPQYSSRTYRILNEVPTLIMVVIVVLVVFKPFG
jgi:protoporphyrinogen IX oxidase